MRSAACWDCSESQLDAVTCAAIRVRLFSAVEALVDAGVGVDLGRQVPADLAADNGWLSGDAVFDGWSKTSGYWRADGAARGPYRITAAPRLPPPGGTTTVAALRELERRVSDGCRRAVRCQKPL